MATKKVAQYEFQKFPKESEKLAPQAKQILDVLQTKGPMTRGDLVTALSSVLKTRQTPARILSFYQKDLIGRKLVKVVKVEVEVPDAPKPEKQAKAKKEKKAAPAA